MHGDVCRSENKKLNEIYPKKALDQFSINKSNTVYLHVIYLPEYFESQRLPRQIICPMLFVVGSAKKWWPVKIAQDKIAPSKQPKKKLFSKLI